MDQNFASPAVATLPLQRPAVNSNGNVVSQDLYLQNLNGRSLKTSKKYLASQHGIDCQALDAVFNPIINMDQNFSSPAVATLPLQRPGVTVTYEALHPDIKPIKKMAMDPQKSW
ncbi:hypothetical protein AVEN_99008-1 [Araneus ventricosus]|uniref:Uncharacterized protein n=1 Tax=Araneus ventricosus TaxID=182803 RepID=A0A4Y2G7H9_ARAVE|nr:hypothetical protein AVEN_99008-1 [Araneus ventricosus]